MNNQHRSVITASSSKGNTMFKETVFESARDLNENYEQHDFSLPLKMGSLSHTQKTKPSMKALRQLAKSLQTLKVKMSNNCEDTESSFDEDDYADDLRDSIHLAKTRFMKGDLKDSVYLSKRRVERLDRLDEKMYPTPTVSKETMTKHAGLWVEAQAELGDIISSSIGSRPGRGSQHNSLRAKAA